MKNLILSILLVLTTIITFNSCKKRIIGCMDSGATNYDSKATESCDSCCTYPPQPGNVNIIVTWSKPCFQCGGGNCDGIGFECSPSFIQCVLKNNCNETYFTYQTGYPPSSTFLFSDIDEGTYRYEITGFYTESCCGSEYKCISFIITSGQTTNISVNL